MEYTKGEWNYKKAGHLSQFSVYVGDWQEPENLLATGINSETNAHLIAAAPDLYEALRAIKEEPNFGLPGHLYKRAFEALAKAEGK